MTERFTVYDIFAVLVPGVLISALAVTTARRLAGIDILDWTGGFGDAALLVIAGYAVGSLLQALGTLFFKQLQARRGKWWRMTEILAGNITGDLPPATVKDVVEALEARYGKLPSPENEQEYMGRLQGMAYQAIKVARRFDPLVDRFQAENHQMRAYVVGFFLLTCLALGSSFGDADHEWWMYLLIAGIFATLCGLSLWRMQDKDDTFAAHVFVTLLNQHKDRAEQEALSATEV